MKLFFITLLILSLLLLISISIAGQLSSDEKNKPKQNTTQLLPCPDKPNCINTEFPEQASHFMPPLSFPGVQADQVMTLAKELILEMGGKIIADTDDFIAATFTSRIFRFVDDFEIRRDTTAFQLHIRSASRAGYSDFGVNKKRVKRFSETLKTKWLEKNRH